MTRKIVELDLKPMEWMKEGACTDPSLDPDWWFPDSEHFDDMQIKLAIKICNECPVQRTCLEYAITNWPVHGIWGGLRTKQLQSLARGVKANNERSNNN